MDAIRRWMPRVLLVGGIAWIAKVLAIMGNGGENTSEGIVAVLFFTGVAGMALGSTGLGAHLTRGRAGWLQAVAVVLSIAGFFLSFVVIDSIAKSLLGDVGASYMEDEHGIWLTGLVWSLVALWLLRRPTADKVSASPE